MRSRLSPLLLLLPALLAAGLSSPSARAQEIVFQAFGDSVTDGYGDTSSQGGGYPRRLQQWLRQRGYDATVNTHGVGGETTAEGLSRIDQVLAEGGDFLLLMEGTNDISHHVGIETIRFNLDEMASRAEALGMIAVHATVIPRIPEAPQDADNSRTSALADSILELGALTHRAVADQFHLFESLPDVFDNYYYYDPDTEDPVGHPNSDGYTEMAGLFLETLLPILESPQVTILPPATAPCGAVVHFGLSGNATFVEAEWDFGDGGWAEGSSGLGLGADYLFLAPGTYSVRLRATTVDGAVAESQISVTVTGTAPAWKTATGLLPVALDPVDASLESELELLNGGTLPAVAEVELLPERSYDAAPSPRRFLVPAESQRLLANGLAPFGVASARGALRLKFYVAPAGSLGDLGSFGLIRDASGIPGGTTALVFDVPAADWSSASQEIAALPFADGTLVDLVVSNLGSTDTSVRLDLFDAADAYVGSLVFDVAAGGSRLHELSDAFRALATRSQPLHLVFTSAGAPYSAAAVAHEDASGDVTYQLAAP